MDKKRSLLAVLPGLSLVWLLVWLLTACGAATPTLPPTPTALPESGTREVTPADDGQTITLQVGESFLLKLGEEYNWSITVADPTVVDRVRNIAVVRGAQGVYEALKAGSTTLEAAGDPVCRQNKPPCALASRLFKFELVVTGPAGG